MSNQPVPRLDQTLSESLLSPPAPLPAVTLSTPPGAGLPRPPSAADGGADMSRQDRLGRFEVHGEIGRGGMGAVLRGRDPALGRDLAIKVLLVGRQGNADATRRFHEEAQIGGQLQHPGLVPVYEMGADGEGRPFFAMKLVDGQTLSTLLKERTSPAANLPRFLTIFEQVCQALGYAHARGVIHRDLKPANIMVGAFGEVQVMDWGLAKVLGSKGTAVVADSSVGTGGSTVHTARTDSGGSESRDGSVMGTPAYMPPEQARGEIDHLDQRSDVFGLGAILCEILTGQPPFTGQNVSEILTRAANGDLRQTFARLDGSGADAELVRLDKERLAEKPEDRPRDGAEVAVWVAAHRAGVEERLHVAELARATAQARAAEERKRRRVQLALAAAVLLMLTLGGGGGWYVRSQSLERQAEQARQQTERVRREAELARAVEEDFNRLTRAQEERKWDEAEKVLERVEGRLGQGGEDELRQRVSQARDNLARVRKDQQMIAKLEDARLQFAVLSSDKMSFDTKGSRKRFEEAFAWYGLNMTQGTPEEVAIQVAARPIREELVIALDRWAQISAQTDSKRLLTIADQADANAWRRQFRDAGLRKQTDLVRRLADQAKVGELPPTSIAFLAAAVRKAGAPKRSIEILREGRQRYPADFQLNFDLANALEDTSPLQAAEMVRYYTTAQALRPNNVVVLSRLGSALLTQGRLSEAEAAECEAIRLEPTSPLLHNNLGVTLAGQGKLPEAVAAYREAIRLQPDYATPHSNLGNAVAQGKLPDAVAAYREAIRLTPDFPEAHNNLGSALKKQDKLPEAVAAYREAIRLKPDYPEAHTNLGNAFLAQGRLPEAVAAYREAIRLKPDDPDAHSNLGSALNDQGKLLEAVASYREAIRLKPDFPEAHYNLGIALLAQGKLSDAVAAYREAIRLKPDDPDAHYNLGNALRQQDKLPEAVAAYREAIRLKPDLPGAHCNLGFVLRQQGAFEASRDAFRRGHELGVKTPGWSHPSEQWVHVAERFVDLDRRLPDILASKTKPANAVEQIEFAQVCILKRHYTSVVRLYADAFQTDGTLATDLVKKHRYHAACFAALAAAGKGEEAKPLDELERGRLRGQALGWLHDDLAAWGKRLDSGKPADRTLVEGKMREWQKDADLAGVRDADALAKLPETERAEWQKLWQDVEALLKRAAEVK